MFILFALQFWAVAGNFKLHQTLEVENIFKEENIMLQLTGFRTTRPWPLNGSEAVGGLVLIKNLTVFVV